MHLETSFILGKNVTRIYCSATDDKHMIPCGQTDPGAISAVMADLPPHQVSTPLTASPGLEPIIGHFPRGFTGYPCVKIDWEIRENLENEFPFSNPGKL